MRRYMTRGMPSGGAILPLMASMSVLMVVVIAGVAFAPVASVLVGAVAFLVAATAAGVFWLWRVLSDGDAVAGTDVSADSDCTRIAGGDAVKDDCLAVAGGTRSTRRGLLSEQSGRRSIMPHRRRSVGAPLAAVSSNAAAGRVAREAQAGGSRRHQQQRHEV